MAKTRKWDMVRVRELVRYATTELLLLSSIVLVWVICYQVTLGMELPTDDIDTLIALLFGAASVAFFVISLLIGILAIFGWQSIKETIADKVRLETSAKLDELRTELRGRNYTTLGFLMAELSLDRDTLKPVSPDRLEYAIDYCREAYETLEKVPGLARMAALNNFAYYLTVRGKRSDGGLVMRLVQELRLEGERQSKTHWILTFCGAVLCYSDDQQQKTEVKKILEDLLKENLPEKQKKEAEIYLASLSSQGTHP